MQYEFHPLANIFPLIDGQAYQDLMADVLRNGVREPVWLYEGKILDGRNRYRAATAMSVDCPTRTYEGDDATGFVISLNLHRRHLTESQRAMVAAKLANLQAGQNHLPSSADMRRSISQADAAEALNVGVRTIQLAKRVNESAPDAVRQAVEQGAMPVTVAAQVLTLPEMDQAAIAAAPREEMRQAAKKAIAAHHKPTVGKPKTGKKAEAQRQELEEARARGVSMLSTYARLTLTAIRSLSDFTEEERELLTELEDAIHNLGVFPK